MTYKKGDKPSYKDQAIVMQKLSQRTITVHPIYIDICDSVEGGLLLSNLIQYFSKNKKFTKTNEEIQKETRLSKHKLLKAKKKIEELPFITITQEGLPAKTYYEIDWDIYTFYLKDFIIAQNDGFIWGISA